MQLGAVAVLSKPFDADDMLTAVCNAKLLHANHNHHH